MANTTKLLKDKLTNLDTAANPEAEEPWLVKLREYIKKEVETASHQKFVGFCFGHQILAMAYGLSVECNESGYEFSATTIQLSDTGKRLFQQDSIVRSNWEWISLNAKTYVSTVFE
jgi:GMP synthase-like glutamine amidotransferase